MSVHTPLKTLLKISASVPLLLLALQSLTGCNEADGAVSPEKQTASETAFNEKIIPILERRCANGCHGVEEGSYDAMIEKDPSKALYVDFPYNSKEGKISSHEYARVYKIITGNHRVDYEAEGRFSHLVRAPLAEDFGGLPHKGLDVFFSTDDPDYKTMVEWLDLEISAKGKEQKPMPANVEYFRDNVLGLLQRNGCFMSSCHGNQVFNDLKLTPPVPTSDVGHDSGIEKGYSRAMVEANRNALMGMIARFINFNGDLRESRPIVKNIPIEKGGVHHRGGNIQFFDSLDDNDVKTLLTWFEMERQVLAKNLTSGGKPIDATLLGNHQGIVFVRGPRHTPRKFFELDAFYPGSDIYLLRLKEGETLENAGGPAINLTRELTAGQSVEIQSVDVRYDARAIVFAMRTREDQGFRLYEIRLNETMDAVEGGLRQLSFAPDRLADGTLIHHVDPMYSPGPLDEKGTVLDDVAITFTSNIAGQYALSEPYGTLGEVDSGSGERFVDAQRPEAAGTFDGKRVYFVSGENKGEWRTIRQHLSPDGAGSGSEFVLDAPLKGKLDRHTSYVIETDAGSMQSSFDVWRFVPGNAGEQDNDKARYEETLRQMTFTHAQERAVTMRTSGEVMFTSVRNLGYQGGKPVFNGAIYRVQAGGFDYHIQGGNRSGYPLFSDSREMGNGLEIRQLHDPRNFWRGGELVLSDHGFGINVESDNPVDNTPYSLHRDNSDVKFSAVPRFVPAMAYFFPENGPDAVTHTGVSPGGSIREPYPLYDNSLLTSYTPDSLNHLDANADPDWDIYQFKFEGKPHTAKGDHVGKFRKIRINAASSDMAEYSAKPLMIRVKENVHAPLEHQKFGAMNSKTKPEKDWGVKRYPQSVPGELECYDYPLLVSFLTNFQPTEAKDFHLAEGNPNGKVTPEDQVFRYVRIVMQMPANKSDLSFLKDADEISDPFATPVSMGIHNKRVIVAEIPIEEDGSFYAEVPTEVPLLVQGLNRDKVALHSMNRWFYLQPGEKLTFSIPRSIFPLRCAGCHGALTGETTDGIGPLDLATEASNVMATWSLADAERRKPYGHGKKLSDYVAVDFRADVQPILDRHCVSCHGDGKAAGNLDLRDIKTTHYTRAYEQLHKLRDPASGNAADKKYIDERSALSGNSQLIKMLVDDMGKQHTNSDGLERKEMLTLIRWIDLGATFKGGFDNE